MSSVTLVSAASVGKASSSVWVSVVSEVDRVSPVDSELSALSVFLDLDHFRCPGGSPTVFPLGVFRSLQGARTAVAGAEVANPAHAFADAFADAVVHVGYESPRVVFVTGGYVPVFIGERSDVSMSIVDVPECLTLERDGQRTFVGIVGIGLIRFAIVSTVSPAAMHFFG